jgi:hypothetical protein
LAYDVFISYSSKDKPAADATCAALEAQDIRCWIAPRDILPGADWGASIVKAIAEAKVFVLIFSSNANASPQISREVERAVNHGIPVIPVRIEDVAPAESLEYFINTPHWLDAFKPPFAQHLTYLVEVVRLLEKGEAGAPPPRQSPAPLPMPATHRRRWLLIGGGVAASLLVLVAVGGFFLLQAPPKPDVDAQCLAWAPAVTNPPTCQALLSSNPVWQGCAASYAEGDMDKRAKLAQQMIASGRTGADLYEASAQFKAYGAISHYWEMFSQCVQEGDLKFDDIASGVAFPDEFWTRTQTLRRVIGGAWNPGNRPMSDFMSNFKALCVQYKASRDKAHPGDGDALDCGS